MGHTLYIIAAVLGVLLGRHKLGVTSEYQQKIENFDISLASHLEKIIRIKPVKGLDFVASIFGVIALICLSIFLILTMLLGDESQIPIELVFIMLYSTCAFFSIKWFTKPKVYMGISFLGLMIWPILMICLPVADLLAGTELTRIIYSIYENQFTFISFPKDPSLAIMGMIVVLQTGISHLILFSAILILNLFVFLSGLLLVNAILKIISLLLRYWGENFLHGFSIIGLVIVGLIKQFFVE